MNTSSADGSGQPEFLSEGRKPSPPDWRCGSAGGVVAEAESGSVAPSILIHEVKSLPNRSDVGKNSVLGKKLARAESHLKEAQGFTPYLAERDPKRAEKLRECASWLLYNQYLESGDIRLASGIFCQQPLLCGFCAAGRAARQVQALDEKLNHVLGDQIHLRPYMVTLTMRSQPVLAPMVKAFWDAWSTMVRRRRNAVAGKTYSIMGRMAGGFVAGEAKRGEGGGWHYHAHGIFLADVDRYQPVWEELKREWASVLGQRSASVQFQPIRDQGKTLREVVKYASKWEPGNYADRWEAFQALTRVRRIRAFGLLYGVKLPDSIAEDLSDKEAEEFVERAFHYGRDGYYEVPTAQRESAFDEYETDFREWCK